MLSRKIRLRVRNEDSAFVTFIVDASQGIATHSTLPHAAGDAFRILEILYTSDFENEVKDLISRLGALVWMEPTES